jgi:hypothetical protein
MSSDNAFLKFHRAGKHLDDLDLSLKKWVHDGHHTNWLEPDPTAEDYLFIKASADEIPPNPFSLLIGDAVQNFRSSLEHLAFALTSAHTDPVPDQMARDSQFPIIGDEDRKGTAGQGPAMFESQRKCIVGMHPEAQAVIQRLQPYHRGKDFKDDPLWILSVLSNIDKHRVLHLVTGYPHVFTFDPFRSEFPRLVYRNAKAVSFELTGAKVERDTLVGRIRIERDPQPKMDVEIHIAPSIAFAEGPTVHDDVLDTLREIRTHIGGYVLSPLKTFL